MLKIIFYICSLIRQMYNKKRFDMTIAQIKENMKHGDYNILQKLLKLSTESAARQKFLRGDKDAVEGMIKILENRSIFCDLHDDEDCSCHDDLKEAISQKADKNHSHDWNEITGKPTEFPPTHHSHNVRDIEGLDDVLHTIDDIRNLSNQKLDRDGSNATGSLASTINNNHNHVNKAILDTVTSSKVNDWDNAASKAHNAVTLGSNATGLTITNQVLQFSSGYQLPTTIKVSEWDEAYLKRHTHGNKAVLDNLTQSVIDQSHTHSNKSVIDGITIQMVNNWNGSFANSHNHNNKSTLDGISSADVTNWDAAHANNHTHANKVILDAITAAYTVAERNKLATVQPNAQANVKADWNATSGDAEILNKPTSFTPASHNHAISDVAGLQSELNSKLEANDLDGFVYNVTYNSTNHQITFYSQNKANVIIDLPIEQLITGVELVGNDLIFTFEDGSVVSVPLNTLLVGVVKSVNGTVPNSNGEIVVNLSDIPNLGSELANKLDVRMNGLVNNLTQAEKNSIYSKLSIVNNIIQTLGISGNTITLSNSGGSVTIPHTDWVNIPNKPTSFTPSTHNHPSSQINVLTGYAIGTNAAISSTDTLNTALGKIQAQINAKTPNLGTVTSVQTGTGLTGGTITNAGTISLNSSTTASLLLADSALQSGDHISELVNDAGYITTSSLPTLGNGALSMTMPTGLNVTGSFTANQSANSSFDLAYANGYQGYTIAEYNKLAGIQINANNYVLPTASNTVSGGIKVGANLSIDTNGVLNSSYINTTYSAGNGLTLSGSVFSLPITQTGTGNAVTAVIQTANGVSVTKGATFLTGFTETDPTVPSHVKAITAANVLDWNSKQSALTNGLHTILNTNKVDIAFDINTPVKDKGGNDRLLFGNTQALDTVVKMGATAGDFSVRTKADGIMFRINGSSNVPYFPLIPNAQTNHGNIAFFDAGNGLWKHQISTSDLITTSNISGYIPSAQNLSLSGSTGGINIDQGGTSVRLGSIVATNRPDVGTQIYSGAGLEVFTNTTGSTGYPSITGGGFFYSRGGATDYRGSMMFFTSAGNNDKIHIQTGATATTFNTAKIIATEEWIATQNFVQNITGGYLEKASLNLSPLASWDTLAENRIVYSSSGANSPFSQFGIGMNFYGTDNNYRGQLFFNTAGSNTNINSLQYRSGDTTGWSTVRTLWDSNNFNPNNYVLKSGDTMTGALNWATGTGAITYAGLNRLRLTNTATLLIGNGSGFNQTSGIFFKPTNDAVATNTWQLGNSGNLELPTSGEGYIARTSGTIRTFNKVYQGWSNTTAQTGVLSFKFPQISTASTMFDVSIKIYGYQTIYLGELRISFYRQGTNNINATAGLRAILTKSTAFPTEIVNVGIDANGMICINLGETTTAWSGYVSFEVERVETKFSGYNNDWGTGWAHAWETDISTYIQVRPVPVDVLKSGDGNYFPVNFNNSINSNTWVGNLLSVPTGTYSATVSASSTNLPFGTITGGLLSFGQVGAVSTRILGARDNSDNLWFQSGDGTGAWRQLASREWANNTFALAGSIGNYLPLSGGTMTGNINFSTQTNQLQWYGTTRMWGSTTSTVIMGSATNGTIIFRPQGTTTGQVTIQSDGRIDTPNHGNSSQWRYEDYGLGKYVSLGNIGAIGLDTTANTTGLFIAGGIDTNIVGTSSVKLLNFGNSSVSTIQGQIVMSHGTAINRLAFRGQQANAFSEILHSDNYTSFIPAQVNITQGTGITVSGTYPNLTIANSAPNIIQTLSQSGNTVTLSNSGGSFTLPTTTYTAGNGLSLTGTTFGQTITTSGTGSFVTGITQTTNGFQVNLGTPPNTVYTAGTGISIASNVITNSAPNATHTGDVTGSTALTIATSAVTHAKYQNIATQTFLGRVSSGTGNVEALTVAQMKSALGIPTVNNGTLNLSVGAGLTGSATFTANQAGVSGFTVGIDSGYVLPTTAQWNNKQNALIAGTGISIIGNTISATGSGGSGITKIFTDNSQQPGPTASQVPVKFTSHEAYGVPEADSKDDEYGNLTMKVETGDVVRWHGSFDATFTVTPAVGSTYNLDIDELRRHIYNVVFIGGVGASTVRFGKGIYEGDQINITVPRGQQINLNPQGVGIISSFGREVQTHANLIWSTKEQQWVLVSYD